MQQCEDRLLTFLNWPSRVHVCPDQLAQAGFCYVGHDDYVQCFCCDGVLQRWQPGDDPWVEHAKSFPRCEYLLQEKRQEFVHQIQACLPPLLKQLLTDRDNSSRECVDPPAVPITGGCTASVTEGDMKEPVCLIESDSDGRLRVVPRAQKMLEQVEQHVVVVSVVGLYRTGKSYLMNKLAGANKGFPLGSTIQSKTKGIWMWCVPHPRKTDHTLVLLDTEGLGDVEKGDETNDNWIFAMAVLLSSTLVYNSMGTIDNKALEKLHYVTELSKHIQMKSNKDDDRTYVRFLPSFVWAVRDFSLDLELDGKPITADEYLENGLKEKPGDENQRYNEPRTCLREFFPRRSCFVFERPANAKTMKRMEELTDKDLDPDFVEQSKEFAEHIYTRSETKTLKGGVKVTGKLLGQLAEMYVKAIRSGEVPSLDNAVKALAEIENTKAVEQAQALYVQGMTLIRFPISQEELSAIHASSESEALALFMKRSFRDDNREYQDKLETALKGEYDQICDYNFMEAKDALIKDIFTPLEDKLEKSYYAVAGGFKKYCKDLNLVKEEYRQEAAKRGLPLRVPNAYLREKFRIGETIRDLDAKLSTAQQREEEGKARRQEAERQRRLAAKQLQGVEWEAARRERAHEWQVAHLQKTHQQKMKRLAEKR